MTIRKNGAIIGGLLRADAALDATSTKPIQNKAVKAALDAMAPLSGTTAPTTSTAGNLLQRYLDTVTMKTYTCVGITNTGTEAEPALSYTWVDDVNAKGGTFTGDIVAPRALFGAGGGVLGLYSASIAQNSCYTDHNYSLVTGKNNRTFESFQFMCGSYGVSRKDAWMLVGGGNSSASANNLEVGKDGTVYSLGGYTQYIHVVPSFTTEYTLQSGAYSHVPSSASTYVLPSILINDTIITNKGYWHRYASGDGVSYYCWKEESYGNRYRYTASATPAVGDNTYTNTALTDGAKDVTAIDNRTHECILDVLFDAWYRSSSDDGTGYYAWKNNDGGYLYTNSTTITAGTTVAYTDTALTESAGTIALYNAADSAFSMVGTYSFEDVDGNAIAPLSTPIIQPGTVVSFLCRYQDLLKKWCIMPVVQGKLDAPAQA